VLEDCNFNINHTLFKNVSSNYGGVLFWYKGYYVNHAIFTNCTFEEARANLQGDTLASLATKMRALPWGNQPYEINRAQKLEVDTLLQHDIIVDDFVSGNTMRSITIVFLDYYDNIVNDGIEKSVDILKL